MSWKTDLAELARENPPLAAFAEKSIQLRKSGDMSAGEALEAALGSDLAKLLLASKNDFAKMLNGEK